MSVDDSLNTREPIRVTTWTVGVIVILCQSAVLWSIDTDIKAIVGSAALAIIGVVTTGEIGRSQVYPASRAPF